MNRAKGLEYLRASQIAQLGACEHKVMLEARLGKRITPEQARAIAHGNERHERFHEQGQQSAPAGDAKRWCFIATAVYGQNAPETEVLRRFRDRGLRPTRWGRACVRLYYRMSPPIAAALMRSPHAQAVTRMALDIVVTVLRRTGVR